MATKGVIPPPPAMNRLYPASGFIANLGLTDQTSNPAVPHIDANLFQFLGHSWAAIAAQAQP